MGGKKKKVTIGWKYYMGLHMLLGTRVDKLLKVRIKDSTVWSGNASGGSISVNQPNIFGGETREGGVVGTADLLMGEDSQAVNSYLASQYGTANTPTYRGLTSIVWRRPLLQSNNSYMFPHRYQVQRTQITTDGAAQPYLAKALIGAGDMNPAHVIHEAITNNVWGMGYPVSSIDNTAFEAMADTLFTEGFGFTFFWDAGKEEVQEFIQTVLNHVSGTLYVDPSTGLFVMKLIRDDYVVSTLPVLDESNVSSLNYERKGWGETVNQVTVKYTDVTTGEDKMTAPVQDIGNIQIQGALVSEEVYYPGIVDDDLAARVALRDLKILSSPLAKVNIKVNRNAYQLLPGSVFKLNWPAHGIVEMVFRVSTINFGTLQNGVITLEALEDVFGMPSSSFVSNQSPSFIDPRSPPAPCLYETVYEASYWEVLQDLVDNGTTEPPFGTDFGMLVACGVAPSGDTYHIDLHTRVGAADYVQQETGYGVSYAELDGAVTQEDSGTYSVKNHVNLDFVSVSGTGSFAYMGGEMVAVTAVDTVAETITVIRGICDCTPEAHADSTAIYFPNGNEAIDPSEYIAPEVADAKLTPTTTLGTLDIASAAAMQLTMNTRYQRPYPPGQVRINSVNYPAGTVADILIAWAHRDRTLQEAYFNPQTEGNIGPEAGTTYTLKIYEDLVLRRTLTGITVTSHTYTLANLLADFVGAGPTYNMRIQLESVRDGYTSWKYQQRDFVVDTAASTALGIALETDTATAVTV